MKTRKCIRYIADCGRGFWNKNTCLEHESNCKCWSNPKYKTCKTCKFSREFIESNGMESEPSLLHVWRQIECENPLFNYDIHFKAAHEKAPDLCINCPVWQQKN